MIMKLYAVYDCVSKEFSSPVMFKNDDVAKRWFQTQALKNVDPSCIPDLRVFAIGEFDVETGSVMPLVLEDVTDSEDSAETTKEEHLNV